LKKYKECCGRLPAAPRPTIAGEPVEGGEPASIELQALAVSLAAARYADLEEEARALLVEHPRAGIVWQLLGLALSKQGKDALQPLMMAAQCLPEDGSVQLNLGNAQARLGRLVEAAASFTRALVLQPGFSQAHNNLGEVRFELGDLGEAAACFRRAIRTMPDSAEAHRNLGETLLRTGEYVEALAVCRRAVELAPDDRSAHNSLGSILARIGQPAEAIVSFNRAIALDPDFVEAHVNLANTLRALGRVEEAVDIYRVALRVSPTFVPAYIELATALRVQTLSAQADAACDEALRLAPGSAEALAVKAELSADQGHFSDAEALFRRAVASDPQCVQAWAGLVRVRRMTLADAAWLEGAQELMERGLPPQREMTLRYAMGKYFDDIGDFSSAFPQFARANELSKAHAPPHDRDQLRQSVDLIIRSHDRSWLHTERLQPAEIHRIQPVFIIGMLRSGTTLAEQILASHPKVAGAGELMFWSTEIAARTNTETPPLQPDDAELGRLRRRYVELLRSVSPTAGVVANKQPTNFFAVGLIHAAFPEARIIHMQRNPLDTCLSIYFQHLEAANTYAHDLADLADYYRQYQRLMDHWRKLLPPRILLDVPYEELVATPQLWTRKMLDFIEVEWDPRCLEFNRTARTVVTASKWQVRQPMNASSVSRWRSYQRFLGPLISLAHPDAPNDERP
jgi:tetratricopeptide (TPR) repeat protein